MGEADAVVDTEEEEDVSSESSGDSSRSGRGAVEEEQEVSTTEEHEVVRSQDAAEQGSSTCHSEQVPCEGEGPLSMSLEEGMRGSTTSDLEHTSMSCEGFDPPAGSSDECTYTSASGEFSIDGGS